VVAQGTQRGMLLCGTGVASYPGSRDSRNHAYAILDAALPGSPALRGCLSPTDSKPSYKPDILPNPRLGCNTCPAICLNRPPRELALLHMIPPSSFAEWSVPANPPGKPNWLCLHHRWIKHNPSVLKDLPLTPAYTNWLCLARSTLWRNHPAHDVHFFPDTPFLLNLALFSTIRYLFAC
jgi:hypothetical protein